MNEVQPFRLAFREEGEFVNVYLARLDSMQDAILLGSVNAQLLRNFDLFEEWKTFFQEWATRACVDILGATPSRFDESRAPEHERSGKA